jgi:hypothetical protein
MLTLDAGAQGAALSYATCLALAVNVLALVLVVVVGFTWTK